MQVLYSGMQYPHRNGEFCKRQSQELYGVFYFYTPFLFEKNGDLLRGEAGDILLTEPGEIVYHGPINNEQSFINDWLYVTNDFASLLEKYPVPCGVNIKIGKQKIINYAISRIKSELNKRGKGYEEKINCILTEMIIDLYRIYLNGIDEGKDTLIESVRDRIMQFPEQAWTINKMAKLSGYSPSYFSSIYVKRYGCSPKAELLQRRLEIAEQMLLFSKLSIGEISERCGFQSVYYFSKYFKKYHGVSPREFSQKEHGTY